MVNLSSGLSKENREPKIGLSYYNRGMRSIVIVIAV